MSFLLMGIDAVERGLVPDVIVRRSIRALCRRRLQECTTQNERSEGDERRAFLESMKSGPIAPVPEKANEQHYELPPEFFALVLGPHRKYSSCYWTQRTASLEQAEAVALATTCERAELRDGQDVLELGCGWGSLSLWMAERFPNSRITSVSNSVPQRLYIEAEARSRGLSNLTVLTADMNDFSGTVGAFDRVVSVEMFEHMRNFELLLRRIASWLRPDGRLFVHHFCHARHTYPFESRDDRDWMAQYFFTGGLMPSEHLLDTFDRDLEVVRHWRWEGTHYERTSNAWLANMDAHRRTIMQILERAYGHRDAGRWFQRWRMFFLAVAELFGYANGSEWFVAHVLMKPRLRLEPTA